MVKITLQFFVHALNSLGLRLQVLSRIQAIINNTSSFLTRKTPNKVVYDFSPRRSLNLLAALSISKILAACINAAKAVFFALLNQKITYDQKHQLFFIKVGK